MAHHKSAKKRNRQNEVKRLRNKVKKTEARSSIKKIRQAIEAKNKELAAQILSHVQSLTSKLAKTNIIHKKTASRLVSRLSAQVSKLT